QHLMFVNPGFEANNVLTLRLRLPDSKYKDLNQTSTFLKTVVKETESLPGVLSASLAQGFPLGPTYDDDYQVEGEPEPSNAASWPVAVSRAVGEHYYESLEIKLLAGRRFNESDTGDSTPVVVVDDTFVRRHFSTGPLSNAVGKRLRFRGDAQPWREIVGVVNHVRHSGLEAEGRAEIYRPWLQMNPKWIVNSMRALDVVVKTTTDPASMVNPI